ncbi:MAG: polyprenyl synthetase family protein [Candidatus Pacebacteria bacterium]|nr:polyprenyl synthetase family protein [Candidatus Paceibacterota bacterium]
MEIEYCLAKLKKQVNSELESFFESKIKQAKTGNEPEELVEIIESLEKFILNSGKRIRPILFYFGYVIGGGKDKPEALKASISIELIHSYFLIHDDIIDRDNFRHGDLSMHYSYAKKAENDFKNIDSKHFGISMAIIAGDLASSLGYEILSKSTLPSSLRIAAINKLNNIILNTATGEILDVVLGVRQNVNAVEIINMQKYKTAKYTIEGPLQLGAILAGADEKFLDSLGRYAIPVGIAFQIQDDIIGVFGDEKKTGKPVGADIREGKKTLLIVEAIKRSNNQQKKFIYSCLGNKNISLDDIKKVRDIIKETGSLELSENKARKLIDDAKKSLNDLLEIASENKKFLNDLADFVVQRKY